MTQPEDASTAGSDTPMTPVEVVYGNLLVAWRNELVAGATGTDIDIAIRVLERLWPDDTKHYKERFK